MWNAVYDAHNEVACLTLGSMTPELHGQLKIFSPYEMLQELKSMFEKQARVERFDLIQTFHACKHEKGKPVGPYVIKMKNYVAQLERLGYVPPQDLSVCLIMNGLTGDFASFAATPQVMAIQGGRIQKANNKSQNAKGKGKGKGKGKDKSYIPKPKNPKPSAKEHPAKDATCHHCKEVGHCKRNCPAYLTELIKKKKQVGTASSSDIFVIELFSFLTKSWVYDTSCGTHICNTKHGLRGVRKLKQVEAIGSDDLVLPNGLVICLDNWHYAPTITRGVVSVARLVDNGFIQCFTNYGVLVSKNNVLYLMLLRVMTHQSERRNRTLLNMVRSMMNLTTFSLSFWDYALETAIRILNMVPNKKVDKTPYELWYGKVPNLSYLKETMGYYFYFPPENKIVVARYAEFLEKNLISQEVEGFEPPQEEVVPIRRSARTHRAPDRLCLNVEVEEHSFGDLNEPTNYKAALLDLESDKWLDAMNAKMQFMKDNQVWRLVDLPPNCFVDPNHPRKVCKLQRFIYGLKRAFDEEIKSRFQQNPGEPQWTTVKTVFNRVGLDQVVNTIAFGDRGQGFDPHPLQGRRSFCTFGRTGSSLSTFGRGKVVYVSTSPIDCGRRNPKDKLRVDCYCNAGFDTDGDEIKSQTRYVFILNGRHIRLEKLQAKYYCNGLWLPVDEELLAKYSVAVSKDNTSEGVSFTQEDAWAILKFHSKWDAPEQVDLTGDVPRATQEDLFGHDARPRPASKPWPAKKSKSDAMASTGGSSASTQFEELEEQELRLKREAAERAFEAQAEKDRTLVRLEELRALMVTATLLGHCEMVGPILHAKVGTLTTIKSLKKEVLNSYSLSIIDASNYELMVPLRHQKRKEHSKHEEMIAKWSFQSMKKCIAKLPMVTAPKPKEELIMYLCAAREAVSTVLLTERDSRQVPVYFVSRALQTPEINYNSIEKLVLALVHATRRLGRYFQAHPVMRKDHQWKYKLKRQSPEPWTLFIDGSSCLEGSGAGLILTSPEGEEFIYALRFEFDASNNESEYEALVAGLRIAEQMGVKNLAAKEVPRSENKKANALSKIASTSFAHLTKQVLVETLKRKSIEEREILAVVEEEGHCQMTTLVEYLAKGTLPAEIKKARALKIKARQYAMVNAILYRKSFLEPWLRCVGPTQAEYVVKEIHEGSCSMHSGPRSVVAKAIRSGYYWPTMHRDAQNIIRKCDDCPFLEAQGRVKFLIIAIDYFTKWTEANPVANNRKPGQEICMGQHHVQIQDPKRNHIGQQKAVQGQSVQRLMRESQHQAKIGMPSIRCAEVNQAKNDEGLLLNLDILEEKREKAAVREARNKAKIE
ncbi:reverse transcriptase domain-containing protein, partial [Tanacetum coccineum]